MERLVAVFFGQVQGVFFRATTEQVAQRFSVTGFVRNEPDGSVRLVAEGERAELERFLEEVKRAKQNHIERTDVAFQPATGEFEAFRIAY